MKITGIFLCFSLLAFSFSGCSIAYGNKNIIKKKFMQHDNAEAALAKEDIKKKFHEPNNIYNNGGQEVYEYIYTKVSGNFLIMIPIVGLFLHSKHYKTQYLYCYFDDKGNLTKYERLKYSGKFQQKLPELPKKK